MKCKEFPQDLEYRKYIDLELKTLLHQHDGIGLAANQVGLEERVFVMRSVETADISTCYFNPVILDHSPGMTDGEEGCLSLLRKACKIRRFIQIELQFEGVDGTVYKKDLDDTSARCAQHEIDHLNGILIFDHINSNLSRKLFLEKYFKAYKKYNRQ